MIIQTTAPPLPPTEPFEPDAIPLMPNLGLGVERAIDDLQIELDALKAEVNMLRRRDETLKFYMTRVDEELRLAARLQQDFLPKALPQIGPRSLPHALPPRRLRQRRPV